MPILLLSYVLGTTVLQFIKTAFEQFEQLIITPEVRATLTTDQNAETPTLIPTGYFYNDEDSGTRHSFHLRSEGDRFASNDCGVARVSAPSIDSSREDYFGLAVKVFASPSEHFGSQDMLPFISEASHSPSNHPGKIEACPSPSEDLNAEDMLLPVICEASHSPSNHSGIVGASPLPSEDFDAEDMLPLVSEASPSLSEDSGDNIPLGVDTFPYDTWMLPPQERQNSKQSSQLLISVCKFDNAYNNCWMNATLQAFLNLKIVREKLIPHPSQLLAEVSSTPLFTALFLRALHEPGHCFESSDLIPVLCEMSSAIPSLQLFQNNDPVDLIEYLLDWLNVSDVQSGLQVHHVTSCDYCTLQEAHFRNLGKVIFLSMPLQEDSISSLLHRTLYENHGLEPCHQCQIPAETYKLSNCPDVLSLYVSRTEDTTETDRFDVTPSKCIEVPFAINGRQVYFLSSVICRRGNSINFGHFWSYVFKEEITIKADDKCISLEEDQFPHEIHRNGVIYFYEKI